MDMRLLYRSIAMFMVTLRRKLLLRVQRMSRISEILDSQTTLFHHLKLERLIMDLMASAAPMSAQRMTGAKVGITIIANANL